ncbi:MAG: hypothetical protein ABJK64_01160 [Paraglaciecola sp.]|uniref:hypothetical protein n=1 Tax=Paraglaciecola sp. TaxID=1920173 RepID=UPI00329923A0
MSKSIFLIWSPALLGVLLVVVVKVDLYQFTNQSIEVQTMLSRELPIVFIGLLFSALIFISSIYRLIKKQWFRAILSVVSPIAFIILFGVGGAIGGAYLNAT